jgi:hypothetical protein
MASTTKTVRGAAYAPDGTEITYTSPPNKWGVAGIARNSKGQWAELAHGNSYDSVRSRAITYANRWGYGAQDVTAVPIYEATAPAVREYFGHHKVRIAQVFITGRGWVDVKLHGGWSNIRKLSKQGVTDVAFTSSDPDLDSGLHIGPAEFTMAALLKSMRLPQQKRCDTVGHSHTPATRKISYNYRNQDPQETALVCTSCAESYSRRTVLTHFTSSPLAAPHEDLHV